MLEKRRKKKKKENFYEVYENFTIKINHYFYCSLRCAQKCALKDLFFFENEGVYTGMTRSEDDGLLNRTRIMENY